MAWAVDDKAKAAKPVFVGSPTPQVGTISVPPVTLIGRLNEILGSSGGGGGGAAPISGPTGGESTSLGAAPGHEGMPGAASGPIGSAASLGAGGAEPIMGGNGGGMGWTGGDGASLNMEEGGPSGSGITNTWGGVGPGAPEVGTGPGAADSEKGASSIFGDVTDKFKGVIDKAKQYGIFGAGSGGGAGGGAGPQAQGGFAGPPVNFDPGNQGNASTIMETAKLAMKIASMYASGGG